MNLERYRIVGTTGHRPQKLTTDRRLAYSSEFFSCLTSFAERELKRFPRIDLAITGMALGWDQAVAQACINLDIPFAGYSPFEGQEKKWVRKSQDYYWTLREHASEWLTVYPDGYASWKMLGRDKRIVDDCTLLLALWSGESGGTAHTVGYAEGKGRPVINAWERWVEYSNKKPINEFAS